MKKIITLKQNTDFRRAYARGRTYTNAALVLYCNKNREGICRVGVTTSKKIGNAVERNRCRRVIMAGYRNVTPLCSGGWDLVFVARFKTKHIKSTEIERIMTEQLRAAGVIKT